jgi:hypothetical protein
MSPETHLERAADAASYIDRLCSDLASLSDSLGRLPATRMMDAMREHAREIHDHLKAISTRLSSLGHSADPGKYSLSEFEHNLLDDASDQREQMMDVLESHQRMRRQ